ncbi:MAG: exo-alpha-sialidase [Candidatus Schekmanbacteria bacterium]|nr:exo-alpha-sialidase [Candidatus Schekmanbacteria bacterium]
MESARGMDRCCATLQATVTVCGLMLLATVAAVGGGAAAAGDADGPPAAAVAPHRIDDAGADGTAQLGPALGVTSEGTIVVAWTDFRDGRGHVRAALSADAGETFSPSTALPAVGANADAVPPAVQPTRRGELLIAWHETDAGVAAPSFLLTCRLTGGGSPGFTSATPVDPPAPGVLASQANPRAACGADGEVVLLWQDHRLGRVDIRHARSSGGGAQLGGGEALPGAFGAGTARYLPAVAASSTGLVLAAWWQRSNGGPWEIGTARSIDSGRTFRAGGRLGEPALSRGSAGAPAVAVSQSGHAALAWGETGGVAARHSSDGGDTFGPRIVVSAAGDYAVYPVLAAASGSDWLGLAWRDDSGTSVWVRTSADGGASFAAPRRLNDVTAVGTVAGTPALAIDDSGSVYAAWTDGRSGDYDIFFARTAPSDGARPAAPPRELARGFASP